MRFSFIPKEMKFFDLFDQTTAHITAAAAKFLEMIERFDDLPRRGRELKDDEDQCDRLVEKTIKALDRSFITPFDREDIHAVATSLDDVMDNMEETAHRFEVFRIDHPTPEAKQLARIVFDCCKHMGSAISLLRDLRKSDQISVHLREIGRLENEADRIYRTVDADLFANANGDILTLIKWRELYAWLEATVDSTKKVTHILSAIIRNLTVFDFFHTAVEHFNTVAWTQLPLVIWLLILLALAFDFLNGLHDAANSIATVVSTRVLSPQWAVLWAAFFNFIAFVVFPLKVAATIQKDIVDERLVADPNLANYLIAGTLMAACAWNLPHLVEPATPDKLVARADRRTGRVGADADGELRVAQVRGARLDLPLHRLGSDDRSDSEHDDRHLRDVGLPAGVAREGRSSLPLGTVVLGGVFQPRSRRQRRSKDHGHHLRSLDRSQRRRLQFSHADPGADGSRPRLPRGHGTRYADGGLEDRQDDGATNQPPPPGRRLCRRVGSGPDPRGSTTFWKGIPVSTTHTITGAIVPRGGSAAQGFSARAEIASRLSWA